MFKFASKLRLPNITNRFLRGKFFTYQTIPLSTYVHIINTGDLRPLQLSFGSGLAQAWERLCEDAATATKSSAYSNTIQEVKQYFRYSAEYITVHAALIVLLYRVDRDLIARLKRKGYVIDTSDGLDIPIEAKREAYARSIHNASIRMRNLLDKSKSKQLTIERLADQPKQTLNASDMIARLSLRAGFAIQPDIKLCDYNAFTMQLNALKK